MFKIIILFVTSGISMKIKKKKVLSEEEQTIQLLTQLSKSLDHGFNFT